MIKENVLCKNVKTGEIKIGNVDPNFEQAVKNGVDMPEEDSWIQIDETDSGYIAQQLEKARDAKLKQLLALKNFKMNNIKTTYNGHVYDFHDINKTFSFMVLALFNKVQGNEISTTWDTVDNGPTTLTNADSLEMIGQFQNYFLNERPALYQNLLDQINNAKTIGEINAIQINL